MPEKTNSIPYTNSLFPAVNPDLSHAELFDSLEQLRVQYGDLVKYKIPANDVVMVLAPHDIQKVFKELSVVRTPLLRILLGDGILSNDDQLWLNQRRLQLPKYKRPNITQFTQKFVSTTQRYLKSLQKEINTGTAVDMLDTATRMSLDSLMQTLFSKKILDRDFEFFIKRFTTTLSFVAKLSNTFAFNETFLITASSNKEFTTAKSELDTSIYQLIKERQALKQKPDDLLTLWVTATDETTGKPFTDKQIKDEVITALFAGHDTTSGAIMWAWYHIAQHPDVEAKLIQEIDETIGSQQLEFSDLKKMPYCMMVIEEILRLSPPVAVLGRTATKDLELNGYTIDAGTSILLTAYITHRHPDYWPNPSQFDPTRFSPEAKAKRPSFAYFPFGGGRHTCLGNHYALLEMQAVLITCLQSVKIRPVNSEKIQPKMVPTLKPFGDFYCTLEARKN